MNLTKKKGNPSFEAPTEYRIGPNNNNGSTSK